jgi:hypothetical protein
MGHTASLPPSLPCPMLGRLYTTHRRHGVTEASPRLWIPHQHLSAMMAQTLSLGLSLGPPLHTAQSTSLPGLQCTLHRTR